MDNACVEHLEKRWTSEIRKEERSYHALSAILRMLVQYISDSVTGVPEDWIPTLEKRVKFLEGQGEEMSLKAFKDVLSATSYVRRRIDKSRRTPKHGKGFNAPLTAEDRERAYKTLNHPDIIRLKSPELATGDEFNPFGEPASDDLDFG